MPTDNDLTKRYDHDAWIGRSRRARLRKPTVKGAVKDAYDKAVAANGPAAPGKVNSYKVLDIWAVGTNPLSEYIVALGPDT